MLDALRDTHAAKAATAQGGEFSGRRCGTSKDNTVSRAISHAACKRQEHNAGVTEVTELPGRGHSLTIDSGWAEVAQTALDFIRRFT